MINTWTTQIPLQHHCNDGKGIKIILHIRLTPVVWNSLKEKLPETPVNDNLLSLSL